MHGLQTAGKCLFCPPHLDAHDGQRVMWRDAGWSVTANQYPYPGTVLHLLLVPDDHVTDLLDLAAPARAGLWRALAWAHDTHRLTHYGLAARSGDCRYTGGTVAHLHLHLVVGDLDSPVPVRVKLSSTPGVE